MPSARGGENSNASTEVSKGHRSAKVICAAALGVRLLVAIGIWHAKPASWFYSQASELGEVAHSIVSGRGISSPFGGDTGPSAFLPPGYPLFISAAFWLFGSFSRGAELAILVVQACFGAAGVFLSTCIARRLFGPTTAATSGVILALDPWLISLGFVFWDTSCSLMLLLALVWITLQWLQRPSVGLAYTAAVLGAVGISVNASLALTCIALFAWAVHKQPIARRKAMLPGVFFLLLVTIWPARNELLIHAFIPLRDNLGYELWQGNRPGADGFFAPELHPNKNSAELLTFRALGELNYMHEKSRIAQGAIASHPRTFLRLTVKRVACFWIGLSPQAYTNQIVIASMTSLLGLCGLFMFQRRSGWRPAMGVLIPLLLFPLPYYITHPDFRFWCLLSPVLTIFAVSLFTHRQDAAYTAPHGE